MHVYTVRNDELAFDYLGDPQLELKTLVERTRVDGLFTVWGADPRIGLPGFFLTVLTCLRTILGRPPRS